MTRFKSMLRYYMEQSPKRYVREAARQMRHVIAKKHGNKCEMCGRKKKLTVDHIIPLSKGGNNSLDNLRILCMNCHVKLNQETK